MNNTKVSIYTFLAVFLTIFLIGAVSIPFGLNYAEQVYYERQAGFNARLAGLMARFVEGRLAAGQAPEEIILEFQSAIAGTDVELGYVCLIDQQEVRYLSHPDLDVQGMPVKPQALFDPDFSGVGESRWQEHLRRGETDSGLLHLGVNMPSEIVHFISLDTVDWTVSSHENTALVEAEVRGLRWLLTVVSVLFGLIIAVPASLAARRVNRHFQDQMLEKHELTQRLLASENARKSQELEGARIQQLSMLPASPPEVDHVRMAFYMNPATEVGGDYYDYQVSDRGTLTVAIGDATGHGLKASTLVTTMKSLFANQADEQDLIEILQRSTRTIKRMGISKLYMAFALVRVRGRQFELVGAGMPPALVYRAGTQRVESIPLKGLPLGMMEDAPYELASIELQEGDVLLLMSDGFPEQFNNDHRLMGYDKAAELLSDVGMMAPEEIIEQYKATLRGWRQDTAQSDDVTFVVLKCISNV